MPLLSPLAADSLPLTADSVPLTADGLPLAAGSLPLTADSLPLTAMRSHCFQNVCLFLYGNGCRQSTSNCRPACDEIAFSGGRLPFALPLASDSLPPTADQLVKRSHCFQDVCLFLYGNGCACLCSSTRCLVVVMPCETCHDGVVRSGMKKVYHESHAACARTCGHLEHTSGQSAAC